MDEEETRIAVEVERRLAQERRELERDFGARRREAKLQEGRLRDRLRQDQADWEAHRREQGKLLADRAETLRRQQESATRQGDLKQRARDDLVAAKVDVDKGQAAAAAAMRELTDRASGLEAKLAEAKRAARASRLLLAATGIALLALSSVWVRTWWMVGFSAVVLAGVAAMHVRAMRL